MLKLIIFCLSVFATLHSYSQVNWLTWDQAMEASKTEEKLVFIDLYTDWCGWCKVMDKKTFHQKEISEMLNTHFYPVKFDAERTDTILFKGYTFVNSKEQKRSPHQLAVSLLDKQMSYPSIVVLNEDFDRLHILKGFQDAKTMKEYLQFFIDKKYLQPSN